MKKIVKYGISGAVERIIAFKMGKATMNIAFSGGIVDSAGIRPATFVAKNEFEQKIIENHPEFKNGTIKVIKEFVLNDEIVKKETPEDKVKTLQQARQFLIDKGIPMEVLQNKAAILEYAAKNDIVFPNWKA